jgi:Predicted membrane protein (DUF2142)
VAIAAAIGVTLTRTPLVLAGTNSIAPTSVVGSTKGPIQACQGSEVVPRGTTAVRMWLQGNVKPRVRVAVTEGSRTVATGAQVGGWLGKVTTVPVTRVGSTLRDALVCISIDRAVQGVNLLGGPSRRAAPGEKPDKMRIEYLRPGQRPWWFLAGSIARRLGMGRAPQGGWAVAIPLALMTLATVIVLLTISRRLAQSRLTRRRSPLPPIAGAQATLPQAMPARGVSFASGGRLSGTLHGGLRRIRGPAWACACVAFLSAASWSILTPPFQAPDEPSHFAYAQILAETGALPKLGASAYSLEESTALEDLDMRTVRYNPAIETISSDAQQRRLSRDQSQRLPRAGLGAGVATSEPPLYYGLQTIPYMIGSGGTLLQRLELMRLLSALLAAATALLAFLFLREALPAVPWAWTVGGLCTALAPLLGFMSGVVNPDAMLCAVSAALFYCLARGFRRGLSMRLAIAIGLVTACGLMTKLNFVGLFPGVLLALVLLARRAARVTGGRSAYRSLAAAIAIAVVPSCVYVLVNLLSDSAALGAVSEGISGTRTHSGSPLQELGYIWQFYLPRLPGTTDYFPGISTLRQIWFDKAVGLYGWLDTTFPNWVYSAALVPAGAIAALCGRELVRVRPALRARAGELLAYAAMALGLLALIGADSYTESAIYTGAFSEPRYLLPLAVLFAATLALAARGAGRRWGPAAGALIVLLILAHDIFSQLLVVGRYYG